MWVISNSHVAARDSFADIHYDAEPTEEYEIVIADDLVDNTRHASPSEAVSELRGAENVTEPVAVEDVTEPVGVEDAINTISLPPSSPSTISPPSVTEVEPPG